VIFYLLPGLWLNNHYSLPKDDTMNFSWRSTAPCLCLALLTANWLPAASATDYKVGELEVDAPWSQELPPNAPTLATFFIIRNHGMNPDRLLSVDTPIAGAAQLHAHIDQDGMMKMQQLDSLAIPAQSDVVFAPMAYHVMLVDVQADAPRASGKQFPLTLHFETAGDLTVQVDIRKTAPSH
jgi:copper(I)-binding protein